jgi:phage protein U
MAERVMLGLGEFRFEIATAAYQKLSLSQSYRWPEQARINRDPALQFVGRNTGEIDLDGVIYPGFKGGLDQVEAMRTLADTAKPQQLVDGLGRVWGLWVITEIGDNRTVFADDGQPRRIEFRVKLKAYGEDDSGQASMKQVLRSLAAIAEVTDVAAQLDTLTVAASSLPEITPTLSPSALTAVVSATQSVVGEVTQTVAGVAREVSGAVSGALSSLRGTVLAAIPPSALQAVREVESAISDVLEVLAVGQELRSTVAGIQALPTALKRDVAGLDGQLRLASYSTGSAIRVLRDTEQTFAAVARIADVAEGRIRQQVADTTGQIASVAERFGSLCDKAQGCTAKVLEKFHV